MFTEDEADSLFAALANVTRRKMLDLIKAKPGQGVGELAASFDVSRIAIMNHLAVLEKANLVISEKTGRTRHLYINTAPIQMIYDQWTDDYSREWSRRMTSIKYLAEDTMAKRRTGDE